MEELISSILLGGLGAAVLTSFLLVALVVYVYVSYSLMTIARKTKTELPWLAWIPIANLYLVTQIAKVPWWTFLIALFAGFIPFGAIVTAGMSMWWWWQISERMSRPGWLGILFIIPIVNLVVIGILAYGSKPKVGATKTVEVTKTEAPKKTTIKKKSTTKKKTTKKTSTKKKK